MKKVILLITVLASIFIANSGFSEPIFVRKSKEANPTLKIVDGNVDDDLRASIENMIKVSNWFDLTDGATGDFTLELSGDNIALDYRLSANGEAKIASRLRGINSNQECAKILVDSLLKTVFDIDALCTTKIVFSAGNSISKRNIMTCDIDGKNANQITKFSSLCVEPSFSPNGRSIVYSNYTNKNVNMLETIITPRKTRVLSSFDGLNTGAAISPNGAYIAMILSKDKQVDLYVRDLNSKKLIRLTRDEAVESSPCFNPEGNLVCYLSDKSGRPQLYVSNLNGSQVRMLPSVGKEALSPDWSTDGKIAYITRIDGDYRIAVLDVKTGRNELVPNLTGKWESPSWAPDNRHLVCSLGNNSTSSTLYVIDTWTGKKRQLFRSNKYFSTPSWSKVKID